MIVYENMTIWVSCVQFLSKLDNFCISKILNLKKVSFSKPHLPPFRQCPAKQQENQISFPPEGKTERQLLCIKGGRKGGKNRRKHVRARYYLIWYSVHLSNIKANEIFYWQLSKSIPCSDRFSSTSPHLCPLLRPSHGLHVTLTTLPSKKEM